MKHYDTDPQGVLPIAKYEGDKYSCDATTCRTFAAAKKKAMKRMSAEVRELIAKMQTLDAMREEDCPSQRNPFV